ncbi:hypothetical protein [Proteiniphilum sp.]|jgi:hypothetical protein|uniref:hypothetical protein n=1 Tax=Proteiniphilum sp. TaxID=1926877 RepID=UPI00092A1D5F|nr:hypothetical protein [Proteiniphilum sp.]MEA5129990.1 hypothetical protein [Proteiniphilum sp.]OJV83309.1 MAG: hypothetical protein BGO34_16730 [Bacteroidia bacterium 44-10]
METKKIPQPVLPPVLPHGWKKEVALALGIHPNTVSRALHSRKGTNYIKIVKTAAAKYGEKIKI